MNWVSLFEIDKIVLHLLGATKCRRLLGATRCRRLLVATR